MCRTTRCTEIKLIDFGFATKYDSYVIQSLNSSVRSEEQVFFSAFGFHSDMWAIGELTYFL